MRRQGTFILIKGGVKMPNKKVLAQKIEKIGALSARIKAAKVIILADYRGLTVEQDTQLRNALRKAGIEYSVIKNSIIRFAVKENGLDSLIPYLAGPTAVAISTTDPVAPAKVLTEFAKKFAKFELKVGVVDGKILDESGIKSLGELPPKDVLISMVLGGFKAPISGFVNVLNGNLRGLAAALNAIREQKESA
jgi:large subunit ribosomal protein L10